MIFDPADRERELVAESESWDTSRPQSAREGDIPVIDVGPHLANPTVASLDAVAGQLRTASEDVGFYQLVGHGLTDRDSAAILRACRRFHSLDLDTKQSIRMDRPEHPLGGVGYLPVGHRKLPRRDRGNLNEAFIVKADDRVGLAQCQWLPEETLPHFRAEVEAYAVRVNAVAMSLLPLYESALELEPGFFDDAFVDPMWRLRLTHYPPDPSEGDEGFGIAPHVDTTFFTLLLSDGPGLIIFSHERDEWIHVPQIPGALIVNSGELLRTWTNDRFLSTRHFATNSPTGDRHSIPFFFNANADHPMECLPTCTGPENPPRYPTISYRRSQAAVQGE